MQGNGRERNRKGPPPITSAPSPPPSTLSPRRESCARCKEQGAGPGVALLPKEPSAPSLASLVLCPPTHTPSCPSLVGTEGGGRPYAQVRQILQKTLLKVQVDVVVGPSSPRQLRPKSAPNWVATMQAQRCIPNPHPRPNLCTHPIQRPNGRDEERSRETDWERDHTTPWHAMTRTAAAAGHRGYHRRRRAHAHTPGLCSPACRRMADVLSLAVLCYVAMQHGRSMCIADDSTHSQTHYMMV